MRSSAVSVVIPAYNAETTISEQLDALLDQDTSVSWELIVCDNGSTDRTRDIVADYLPRFASARLVDASLRRGPAAARNAGAREATGRWLLFCDADDVVDRSWISDHVAALRGANLVVGDVEYDRLRPRATPALSWLRSGPLVFRLPALPWLDGAGSGNISVEREVFLEAGGFEERLRTAEDADLVWRLQLSGIELVRGGGTCHIRVRHSFRALARQAFGYGAVYKMLDHRYARVRAAHGEPGESGAADDAESALARARSNLYRGLRRLLAFGDSQKWADITWGFSHRLGQILGPTMQLPQVLPDGRIGVDGER
ncbi:glycosyltransferase [Microbacterium profundi]|uniref:glycosyltransferase n=1 Tax=Microbacterium profundi TaxID=450380 RepID=UPI001F34B112|nr:glycosyltransferase [Microbacterium profundi]MCE7481977.1 glycosyltransferase [Microbacterium profundi]